jgi:hypothetical protein
MENNQNKTASSFSYFFVGINHPIKIRRKETWKEKMLFMYVYPSNSCEAVVCVVISIAFTHSETIERETPPP